MKCEPDGPRQVSRLGYPLVLGSWGGSVIGGHFGEGWPKPVFWGAATLVVRLSHCFGCVD
jgi:hypothetical protein